MDKVVVTGGAGFIGSHLCEKLVRDGFRVVAVDTLRTGHRHNLAAVAGDVELVQVDVRDADAIAAAVSGARWVFHEAAMVSVVESIDDPVGCDAINNQGTLNVLLASRRAGVERVVFAASAAAYGRGQTLPKREDDAVDPISPYAVSKLAGEHWATTFSATFGLPVFPLRYFNVYGPRQDPSGMYSGVISKFVDAIGAGRGVTVFGDGLQTRDFVSVHDVVAANLAAIRCDAAHAGVPVNIGTGRSTTLLDLIATLGRIVGCEPSVTFREARPGDPRHSCASIDRATQLLGYAPQVALHDGLSELVTHELR